MKRWKLAILLGVSCPSAPAFAQQLAFPEAEGFGRFATGARTNLASASVYHVTNLNDTGSGSFRDAVSQSNRFIVFDVGGIAKINSVVTFASNITIAGQTAPGGFQVYGNRVAFHGANNLVSRYWGARNAATNDNDAASIARGTNMIFDHMSITWGRDGTFDINPDSGQVIDNLTIQNTVIAQGLQASNHSTGGLMTLEEGRNFSIIKSLFADNKTRNPKARGNNEYLNNIVYGWTEDAYIMGDTTNAIGRANAEGNYFIRGPLTSSHPFTNGTAQFQIYGNGNLYDSNQNGVADGALVTSYPGATVMATRHNFPTTSVMTAPNALAFVIDNVGPSITRDVVDTNLVNEVKSYGTLGGLIVRETDVYPNYDTDAQYVKPRSRLPDSDADGMPDNWETSRGYNPTNGTDWKTVTATGYSRLEDYLNELGGYNATRTSAGGTWTAPATWGGASVPTFANTVVVTGGVTHSSGYAFARQLTVDGSSSIAGGSMDVFDTLLIGSGANGSLSLSGGTLAAGRILLASPGRTGTLTVLAGGTLQLGILASGGGTASLILDGGTVRALPTPSIGVPLTVNAAGGTLDTAGQSLTIISNISGTGTLNKNGAGTLTLGGNNSGHTGGINLNAGAITLNTITANSSPGTITAANGTQISVNASGASTPLALANGATVTITAGGFTYSGTITGGANTTLLVNNSSTGTSNFSIGGNLTNFAGTLDLADSTGNIRIGSTGSALANFDAGDSTGTFRTSFDGTTNFGSLSGGANTRLQGSTNGTLASTYVIGANGNSTTFAGTITNGTSATPAAVHITKTGAGTLILSGTANTYTGVTALGGGVLTVASLGNGGVASSIGQSPADAANLVFNGGTLRYIGTTAQNTNRLFTLGTGPTAGKIDASSSNHSAVSFTGTGAVAFTGTGARTLTLMGSSTGANTIAAAIADGTGPAAGTTAIVKSGAGTWNLTGANTYTGGTTVQAGKLVSTQGFKGGGPLTIAAGAAVIGTSSGTSSVGMLSISGRLDITNNAMVVKSSNLAAVQTLIASGFADSAWNGVGINSSSAAADPEGLTAIGYVDNGELGASDFEDVTGLDGDDILVKYTYYGDADLSGTVILDDFFQFLAGYNSVASDTWFSGDFNYSGETTLDDFFQFLHGYNNQGAPLSALADAVEMSSLSAGDQQSMLNAIAAVPEPASVSLLVVAGVGTLSQRRRR